MTRLTLRKSALIVAAVASLVVFAPAASGSDVSGKAGVDTSLKATDSKVMLPGRGPFADLRVTVNQTRNLLNQAVSVTWTGGATTRSGPGRFASNYLQFMQCWGDDDGSNSENPGPPPSQCEAGASQAVYGGVSGALFPNASFATERIISAKDWNNFDQSAGVYDDRTQYLWQPFRGVDGKVTGVHLDPTFNPASESSNYWLNPYFNIVTTNEIPAGKTGPNGTGAELLEVVTGVESSGLGCGQAVEPVDGGGKRIPKCWLVVVPRGSPTQENVGTPFAESADEFGVMTSPLSPSVWKNRISFPLDFTPVDSKCSLADNQRQIVGSELILPAVTSWQAKLCETPGRSPYAFGLVADANARRQLVNPAPGSPGMIAVSRPIDDQSLDPESPTVYAPLSLSGIVVGFNIERLPLPTADSDAQKLSGIRIATLNLTPRLLAKILTQSYRAQVDIKSVASPYEWVKKNPAHLGVDKDFLQFNPEFGELLIASGKNFGGLLMPTGNSDVARQVWEYVFADAEAKAWLDGAPDPFGMKVNPYYATTAAANTGGTPFGDPIPTSFPKSDPYCFQGAKVGQNRDIEPPPLCGTDWLPFTQGLRDGARLTRLADDGAKIVEDLGALSSDKVYRRDLPQQIGSRVILTITDSASAFQYGVQSARLSRAGDNGPDRSFIAPNIAGLTAGFEGMKPGTESAVLEPDPKQTAAAGYPLTAITYAAIRPLARDADARREYADFVAYAGGEGQVSGFGAGTLPEGFAPLPATLKTQATTAAQTIRELTAPEDLGLETPRSETSGGAENSANAGSGFPGFSNTFPATFRDALSLTDPATVASPLVAQGPPPRTSRTLTPAVSVPATRFVLPALAGLALIAGLLASEITRRPRRAVGAVS